MVLEDKTLDIGPGEFIIIPKGVTHKPIAEEEVHLLLFEPASTLHTGNLGIFAEEIFLNILIIKS